MKRTRVDSGAAMQPLTAAAIAIAALLSACGTVSTKDALSDKDNYFATNFVPAKLPPTVRAKIESGESIPDRFKTLRLIYSIQNDDEDKKSEVSSIVDLTNLGNGYVQSRSEFSKNSIPYRVNLGLTFGGIYRIRTQTLFLGQPNAMFPNEAKEITKFDRGIANPKQGGSYAIESTSGTSMQIASFTPENFACIAGNPGPASAVLGSISGEALPLDCTVVGLNGVVVSKMSFWWLSDYGVSIQREVTNSQSKSKYLLTALSVVR